MQQSTYQSNLSDTAEKSLYLILSLLQTSDPLILSISLDDTMYDAKTILSFCNDATKAKELVVQLRNTKILQIETVLKSQGKLLFQADIAHAKIQITGKSAEINDAFYNDLVTLMHSQYGELYAKDEHIDVSINFQNNSMVINRSYLLNENSKEADFLSGSFKEHLLFDTFKKHTYTFNKPVRIQDEDFIMSIYFLDDGSLSIVNFKFLAARDNEAVFEGLSEKEAEFAFDHGVAFLKKNIGNKEGSRFRHDGILMYGYEKSKFFIVKDEENGCVSLVLIVKELKRA